MSVDFFDNQLELSIGFFVNRFKMELFKEKEWQRMKKHIFGLSLTIGAVVLGVTYVAKKTGFFEDDRHLYDEFESR